MARRLTFAFVLTGFAGLVYQTAWGRMLRLAFGGTAEALATVLAAFLGGLALGAAIGGRVADRRDLGAALRLFAAVEVLVALLSLAGLPVLARFPELYAGIERGLGATRAVRGLAAAALLLPPTALMGATLPLLVRAAVRSGVEPGRAVARLYAVNTAGAVLGALATGFVLVPRAGVAASVALATGFVLVPRAGVAASVALAAGLDLVAAGLVASAGRRLAASGPQGAADRPAGAAPGARPAVASPPRSPPRSPGPWRSDSRCCGPAR